MGAQASCDQSLGGLSQVRVELCCVVSSGRDSAIDKIIDNDSAGLVDPNEPSPVKPHLLGSMDPNVCLQNCVKTVVDIDAAKVEDVEIGPKVVAGTALTLPVASKQRNKAAAALLKGIKSGRASHILDNCEVESGAPSSDPGSPFSSQVSSKSGGSLRGTVKKIMTVQRCSGKVSMDNKIGLSLAGWYKDVAFELQRGIAAEGRSMSQAKFHAPSLHLFSRCRDAFGFPPARYYATMGLQDGLTSPNLALISAASAAGKSDSFFFLSPDQQLIAKSCTAEDWSTLLRILPDYVEYVEGAAAREKSKPKAKPRSRENLAASGAVRGFCETLLPRYLGLYSLHIGDDPKPVQVLVMTNAFSGAMSISRKYDLKGSTHGRKASKKECAKKSPILKDIDWVTNEPMLRVNAEHLSQLLASIQMDTDFLVRHGLMDYSLLVGIHDIEGGADTAKEVMNVVTARDSTRHCYLGIIDVLTPYRLRKRAETFALGTLFCGRDVSCQNPRVYADRFYEFAEKQVFQKC